MLTTLNAEYKGDMIERYMCLKNESGEEDFREKMLENNRIKGYLPLVISGEGEEKEYRYVISDCHSLSDHISEKSADSALLRLLLTEMEKIFIRGRAYMFEEDNYVLHPSAIYFSSGGELRLCYLPGYEKNVKEQIAELLSFLMSSVDVNDRESVYVYYSSYMLAREENCTFRSLIGGLDKKPELNENEESEQLQNRSAEKPGEKSDEKEEGAKAIHTGKRQALGYAAVFLVFTAVVLAFLFL